MDIIVNMVGGGAIDGRSEFHSMKEVLEFVRGKEVWFTVTSRTGDVSVVNKNQILYIRKKM